jgi:hypothetical protein
MAGRFLGFIITLIVFPVMAAAVGYTFFDQIPGYVNALQYFPMDAVNTLTYLRMIFAAGIFVFVFAVSWNYMAQNQNEASDQVV